MLTVWQKPIRIFRRDGTTNVLSGATVDSNGAPSYGWSTITIYANLPQSATIKVLEKTRTGAAFNQTFTSGSVSGVFTKVLSLFGEHVKIQFINGGTAQTPEVIVTLA